ncbi:MAG: hypothetical protein CMJ90_15785 [Planctomycetes bacterium]|nr:hypothetical protein [Planctomycetota bacterium]
MNAKDFCILALLVAVPLAAGQTSPFRVEVVDRATGRGVPLVELETTGGIRCVTDSAGVVAFDEVGLLGERVWLTVRSHGYTHPKDGFGRAMCPIDGPGPAAFAGTRTGSAG